MSDFISGDKQQSLTWKLKTKKLKSKTIIQFTSLTSGHKMCPTSLSSPFSMFVRWSLQLTTQIYADTGPGWTRLFVLSQIMLCMLQNQTFNEHMENECENSRPVSNSEAPTFNCRHKKINTVLTAGGLLELVLHSRHSFIH